MKILSIGSGSKGNCTYIESLNTHILIDCGLSKKKVSEHLNKFNHSLDEINAILITHEHSDHIGCIKPIFKATNALVYITEGTYYALDKETREKVDLSRVKFIKNNEKFKINDVEIESFKISHDVADPVGFIIKSEGKKFVYITDTGTVFETVKNKIKDADCYIFESNHDPELEMSCSKPYPTKLRVLGDEGHLSNEDSACVASEIISSNCKYFLLAHLSEECNTPSLALETYKKVFKTQGFDLGKTKLEVLSQSPNKEYSI